MRKFYILAIWLIGNLCIYGQTDVLRFNNNEIVKGEIKGMQKGILTIETDYSDDDFTLEWDKVTRIITENKFRITLTDGSKYYGTLFSNNDSQAVLNDEEHGSKTVSLLDIFELSSLDEGFGDRLSASIDLSFDMAKAKNLRSFSTNASAGYKEDKWNTNASYNTYRSRQDDVDEIKRWEGKLTFNYILGEKWYPNVMVQWLSNTEQQLDLRQNCQLGLGRYLVRSNEAYWGIKFGVNNNYERYYSYNNAEPPVKTTTDNNSWEGFLATEVDLFDMGDLSLYALVTQYVGLTESGRWRTDAQIDCKYDLPLDFYIKVSMSLNHDNKPADGAGKSDYVLNTGFGWEW